MSLLDSPFRRKAEAAEVRGAEYGRQYGEYLAWADNLTAKLSEKWAGVSVMDRMSEAEKAELANKFLDATSKLPALPQDLFSDPDLGKHASAGFSRGLQEKYETDIAAVTMANAIASAVKIALPVAVGLMSSLGRKVVLDLFGGKASQVRGAINVDVASESGIRADILKWVPLKSSVADEILVTNPYIGGLPQGSNAANTWLPEAARLIKPGGRITVTGKLEANEFAKMPNEGDLKKLGLRVVREPGAVTDPRLLAQTMLRSDGAPIEIKDLRSYILEKM